MTGSPEVFTGRGIGVCRKDGKWKMATVRVREKRTARRRRRRWCFWLGEGGGVDSA